MLTEPVYFISAFEIMADETSPFYLFSYQMTFINLEKNAWILISNMHAESKINNSLFHRWITETILAGLLSLELKVPVK